MLLAKAFVEEVQNNFTNRPVTNNLLSEGKTELLRTSCHRSKPSSRIDLIRSKNQILPLLSSPE
jgi:hypothetical protein